MKRRTLLGLISAVGGMGMLGIFNLLKEENSKLEVVFKLPENMSREKYAQTSKSWLDLSSYKEILSRYSNSGLLLPIEQKFESSREMRTIYKFMNRDAALKFCDETIASCNYNFKKRESLGIFSATYLDGQKRSFS